VRFVRPGHFRNAFSDQRLRHNHLRLAVIAFLRRIERVEKRLHILAVNLLDIETVGFEAFPGVLALRNLGHGIKRDGVVVVNENQIIEAEVSSERARFSRNAFLQTTVTRETHDMLIKNPVLGRVEARGRHLGRHRDADRVTHTLSERTGGAFHAGCFKKLRVARRLAVQLPETLDLVHREIVSAHV
jgi:hypothetical protein